MYYVGVTCHIIQPGPFKTSIVDPGEMQFALQKSDATDSEVRAFYGQQWLDKCEKFSSIYTCRIYLNILLSFFSYNSTSKRLLLYLSCEKMGVGSNHKEWRGYFVRWVKEKKSYT